MKIRKVGTVMFKSFTREQLRNLTAVYLESLWRLKGWIWMPVKDFKSLSELRDLKILFCLNQIIFQLWWSGWKIILLFWVFLGTNWRWGLKLKLTENYQLPCWLLQILVRISLKNISPSRKRYSMIHPKSKSSLGPGP